MTDANLLAEGISSANVKPAFVCNSAHPSRRRRGAGEAHENIASNP
jgi:hypothetical protein